MKIIYIILILVLTVPLISPAPPNLPIKFNGKVIYNNNLPIPNVKVVVFWTDNNDKINRLITYTMDFNDSTVKKNPQYLGTYCFKIDDIKEDTTIILKVLNESREINTWNYGSSIRLEDIIIIIPTSNIIYTNLSERFIVDKVLNYLGRIIGTNDNIDLNSTPEKIDEGPISSQKSSSIRYTNENNNKESNILSENSSNNNKKSNSIKILERSSINSNGSYFSFKRFSEYASKKFNFEINIYLLIPIFLIIFSLLLLYYLHKNNDKPDINFLKDELTSYKSLKPMNFIDKKPSTLSLNDNLIDVLEIFVSEKVSMIPVIEDRSIYGIVSKKDFLIAMRDSNNPSKTKVNKIMKKEYLSCDENIPLNEICNLFLKNDSNELIVKKNDEFIGTIDLIDLLSIFYTIENLVDNAPPLKEYLKKDFKSIDPKTKLNDFQNMLLKENLKFAIVKTDSPGIITIKDIIFAIHNNYEFSTTVVEDLITHDLKTLTPGNNIYDAISIVKEREFNQIPIVYNQKIIGIITLKDLLKACYNFIKDLDEILKNKQAKDYIRSIE